MLYTYYDTILYTYYALYLRFEAKTLLFETQNTFTYRPVVNVWRCMEGS